MSEGPVTYFNGVPVDSAYGFGIGYDAVRSNGRRSIPAARSLSEDWELRDLPRRQLTTILRDLQRNFSIVAWAIRRHLDYVSTFSFHPRTGNDEFDKELDEFLSDWSQPENCDWCGRHSLQRLIRQWEMRRVVDGDVLVNYLRTGETQTIEGDRIMTQGGIPFAQLGITDPRWVVNGVWCDPETYKDRAYMVFKRPPNQTGLVWDCMVGAGSSRLFGYFDRTDQVRGISPLAAAANSMRDIYENIDFALLKAKIAQLFGIAFFRKGSDPIGNITAQGIYPAVAPVSQGASVPPVPGSNPNEGQPRYDVRFGRGPLVLDLEPGDEVKTIQDESPSTQFKDFHLIVVMVALKALDIPFSFFDESHTNWIGQRQANIQYEMSARIKQKDLQNLLIWLTKRRLATAILRGEIDVPDDVDPKNIGFDWVHAGTPWVNPLHEVSADVAAVNAGFDSPISICRARGKDFYRIIDERADAEAYCKKKGVVLSTALASNMALDPAKTLTVKEDVNEETLADDDQPKSNPADKPDDLRADRAKRNAKANGKKK